MKTNKKVIVLAICLAMFAPTRCDESIEETIQETEIVQLQAIEIEEAQLLLERMIEVLNSFADNLVDDIQFKLNDRMYAVEFDTKKITVEEQDALATIVTDVVDSALDAIADKIQEMQIHTVSQEDAMTLLQTTANSLQILANNLVIGSTFNLNGINYVVQTHKAVEEQELN